MYQGRASRGAVGAFDRLTAGGRVCRPFSPMRARATALLVTSLNLNGMRCDTIRYSIRLVKGFGRPK